MQFRRSARLSNQDNPYPMSIPSGMAATTSIANSPRSIRDVSPRVKPRTRRVASSRALSARDTRAPIIDDTHCHYRRENDIKEFHSQDVLCHRFLKAFDIGPLDAYACDARG